jgi:hypothetical protein
MRTDHGGDIKLYIQVGPFHSSCCDPDANDYAQSPTQPQNGVHFNTGTNSGDDPYYYRKAILKWYVEDINFSNLCAECYDPMESYDGHCFDPNDEENDDGLQGCNPPLMNSFQGCRDDRDLGDAFLASHFECPQDIGQYFQEVIQEWHFTDVGYPPEPEDDGVADTIVQPRRSDERWKQNIESVGISPSGLPIYEWEYLEELNIPGKYRGTIAQELIKCNRRDAIVKDRDGYYWVNYNKIDIKLEKKGYDKIRIR